MSVEPSPPPLNLPSSLRPNTPLQMDGLEFLGKLSSETIRVAFFDPQYRGLYDKLRYGNEGVNRQQRRAEIQQMDNRTITAFIAGIDRVLIPQGHLFLWVDKFHLVEGPQPWIHRASLKIVDMITWSKRRMGLGYRSRNSADYCMVLQKPPLRAKGVWKDNTIEDVHVERLPRPSPHPHAKPEGLQKKLIEAVSDVGDLVIDPAAGSFSVLKAARKANRIFLGCDLIPYKEDQELPNHDNRTTEYDLSVAVLRILLTRPDGAATLPELREELPRHIVFTDGDLEFSPTRPGERLWEQLLRNIQSHHASPGNFIYEGFLRHIEGGGYAITEAGREFIVSMDAPLG